jgi:hypothetical protein
VCCTLEYVGDCVQICDASNDAPADMKQEPDLHSIVPRGLAKSNKCDVQVYSLRPHVYGVQFHPEMSTEMLQHWTKQQYNIDDLKDNNIQVSELREEFETHKTTLYALADHLFTNFFEKILQAK